MTADTSVLTVLTNAINAGRQITVAELKYAIADAQTRGYRQAIKELREVVSRARSLGSDADAIDLHDALHAGVWADYLENGLLPEGTEP